MTAFTGSFAHESCTTVSQTRRLVASAVRRPKHSRFLGAPDVGDDKPLTRVRGARHSHPADPPSRVCRGPQPGRPRMSDRPAGPSPRFRDPRVHRRSRGSHSRRRSARRRVERAIVAWEPVPDIAGPFAGIIDLRSDRALRFPRLPPVLRREPERRKVLRAHTANQARWTSQVVAPRALDLARNANN